MGGVFTEFPVRKPSVVCSIILTLFSQVQARESASGGKADTERRVLNQPDDILGNPVLVPVGQQAVLFVAGIFQIPSRVYGHKRSTAAHGLKARQRSGVKNTGADKNISPVIVIAEFIIIQGSEKAVFAAGLHFCSESEL